MTIYMEFADEMERRRRRLARQQFWLRERRAWRRHHLLWTGIFALLLAGALLWLLLAAPANAQAAPPEKVPPPRAQRFSRAFLAESAALTATNIFDGIATVRSSKMGIPEANFPHGGAEFLGRYPGAGRYALVMASEQAIVEFAAWKLERSRHKALRISGHVLMLGGAVEHMEGAIGDLRLQQRRRH